jgi:hypothetical protein
MNYQFDLATWMERFPLEMVHGHYDGRAITSPRDLCNNEWLRRFMKDEYEWGTPVPADIFVMALGEPENRFATKIGGLPYRRAVDPWPQSKRGNPLQFVAQFNLADSTDIVGKQPGDLLLVFANDDDGTYDQYHFEWQNLSLRQDQLARVLPANQRAIEPCYGHRCRVHNYPDAQPKDSKKKYPQCKGSDVWSDYFICQYQATQIGKAPFEPQGRTDGKHLCTISSVQPDIHSAFPWVNVDAPICREDEWIISEGHLMIGDMGCIFVCYDRTGSLSVEDQCF